MLTLKIAALLTTLGLAYGCANESVQQPGGTVSTPGSSGEASFSATASTATVDPASASSTGTAAAAATPSVTTTDNETRAKQVTLLNNEINSEESQLEIAEQNQVTLEASLSNAQTKDISGDTGTAVGSGVAGAAEVGLAVATGNIFVGIAGIASLGVAAGSAINASQTSNTVTDVSKELQN